MTLAHLNLDAQSLDERLFAGTLHSTCFAMGCFWGPDASLGSLPGVVQTRVGYAGAAAPEPNYRNLQGHAEVIRVLFDPNTTSYETLLAHYRANHKPRRVAGQYRSLLFPANEAQHRVVEAYVREMGDAVTPEVMVAGTPEARFWDAEDRHQKYRLRRNKAVTPLLEAKLGPRWDEHTLATKLNASGTKGFDLKPWLSQLSEQAQRAFRRG